MLVTLVEREDDETTLQQHHKLTIYIRAQGAEATPPLGTVLGNLGVNSIKFCKEFNEFTQDLPSYITLGVSITVMENRSYSFELLSGPSIGQLVALLRYEARLLERNQLVLRHCISLRSVVQLALYRFPQLPLQMSLPTVVATMNASSLTIIYESPQG
jgi:ribosomal protein L11